MASIIFLTTLLTLSLTACGSENSGGATGALTTGGAGADQGISSFGSDTGVTVPEDTPKADNQGNYQPTVPQEADGQTPEAPADISSLSLLESYVTAQKSYTSDAIDILFYVQGPGSFTIQEKLADGWRTVGENIFYPGSGGLNAGALAPGEDSKTLRVLFLQNDRYTGITREVTVLRAEVMTAGGIKTYSGG